MILRLKVIKLSAQAIFKREFEVGCELKNDWRGKKLKDGKSASGVGWLTENAIISCRATLGLQLELTWNLTME